MNNMDTPNVDPYNSDDPYNVSGFFNHGQYDGAQKAMLRLHPWMLLGACIVLSVGGIYSGVIAPIGRRFRMKHFTEGYAHAPHLTTVLLSALVGISMPIATIINWIVRNKRDGSDYVQASWALFNYWESDDRFVMPGYLFWYIYQAFYFGLLMGTIFSVVSRWKPLPTLVQQVSERHGFIIVCHNSTRKMKEPIEAILKFAQPHQIFIADNGSTEEEQRSTRNLCASYTIGDSRIQVAHLRYGNKTLAQYACVLELVRRFNSGESKIDIVTLIDDDVMIPATFPGSSLEKQFEDDTKIAIAFPLRVANADKSVCAALQDCEYLVGNVARYVQDELGSQLFASGAIATWKIQPLQHVLERHCTAFNGEDLEMGYLLHKLSDYSTSKLDVNNPVCIGFERNCVVPTTAPFCYFHWYDTLPASLKRKFSVKTCKCGEHSLFNQRIRSWDPASHQFFFKLLQVVLSPRGTKFAPKAFIRVLCLWKLISLLREYILVISVIWSFARLTTVDAFVSLIVFYADCIIISWGFVITTWTQSLSCSRQGLAMREDVLFLYPILFELPYALVIRVVSVFYSFVYYLYWQRFPKDVRAQMKDDPEKADCIENVWKNEMAFPRDNDNAAIRVAL